MLVSFNYVLTPMLSDLGLTQAQASVALSIPPIASLLIVFLASSSSRDAWATASAIGSCSRG